MTSPDRHPTVGERGDVVVEALGVDQPEVLGSDPDLLLEEGRLGLALGIDRNRVEHIEDGLDIVEAARFFALLNVSIFDGYIASFDSKFHYNHWRPYTAIRWASNDGNPDTIEEADWTNLHDHTYAFPSYPSAHGTVCAAAMTVFEDVFGRNRGFVMTIPEVDSQGPLSPKVPTDPPSRAFTSFDEAAVECSLSRVYLGIHFRYDSEAGTQLGRRVGAHAVANHLQAGATNGS